MSADVFIATHHPFDAYDMALLTYVQADDYVQYYQRLYGEDFDESALFGSRYSFRR